MNQTLARQALADPEVTHEVDRVLLENAGTNPILDVFAIALFDDDAVDVVAAQQQRQKHSGRSGPYDADLSTHAKPHRGLIRVPPSLGATYARTAKITCQKRPITWTIQHEPGE
jgi:streptomycin 6-kinase